MLEEIILPIGAGLVTGFLIGLTGMGGGALMTPFLLVVMKLNPLLAVGTDLTFAAITKIIGGFSHRAEKNVSLKGVFWMALGSLPAAFVGARIVLTMEDPLFLEETLPQILGGILVLVSVIIMARIFRVLGPTERVEIKLPSPGALILIGAVGGFLVGMTSIGGGTVIMALLLIFFSLPLNQMVGLDVMHGAVLAIFAAGTYAYAGKVEWDLVGLLLIGSIPGVWIGAKAVSKIDRRLVRGVLAGLIFGAGLHLITG
jgi:uncharacterized membrane protein YfcA